MSGSSNRFPINLFALNTTSDRCLDIWRLASSPTATHLPTRSRCCRPHAYGTRELSCVKVTYDGVERPISLFKNLWCLNEVSKHMY
jgi:hypothetical protein